MSSLKNRVQLIGHLGADPEVKTLEGGLIVARLRIATNERYKTQSGEWKDDTTWHNVSAWERLAERIGQQLQKGSYLMVEGKLVNRNYIDGNGVKKYYTEIRAHNIVLLDKKTTDNSEPVTEDTIMETDLPF